MFASVRVRRRLDAGTTGLKRVAAKRVDYPRGKRWPRFAGKFRCRIENVRGCEDNGKFRREEFEELSQRCVKYAIGVNIALPVPTWLPLHFEWIIHTPPR